MEHIMTLHNVSASYDGREVLSDLSLDIPARRITAVIGPSGCGKTTLLRCMNGLLAEEKGVSVSGRILLGSARFSTPAACRPQRFRRPAWWP